MSSYPKLESPKISSKSHVKSEEVIALLNKIKFLEEKLGESNKLKLQFKQSNEQLRKKNTELTDRASFFETRFLTLENQYKELKKRHNAVIRAGMNNGC